MARTLDFAASKTDVVTSAQAKVLIVVFNTGGLNGIGDGWRSNGLSSSSTVACGAPASCTFPGPCSTIWIELPDCATFDLARMRVVADASEFGATTAIIVLEASVRDLPEDVYTFQLHLPVTDTVLWTYQTMDGRLVVSALADARLSNVTVCQGPGCVLTTAGVFVSTNDASGPVLVRIAAADVHGFALLRSGEALLVVISGPHSMMHTSPAVFDELSKQFSMASASTLWRRDTLVNATFEDFELLSIIGHGTFGKEYLVRERKKKTLHAMKCIGKDIVIEHESVESLEVEKLILLQVNHPFIIGMDYVF